MDILRQNISSSDKLLQIDNLMKEKDHQEEEIFFKINELYNDLMNKNMEKQMEFNKVKCQLINNEPILEKTPTKKRKNPQKSTKKLVELCAKYKSKLSHHFIVIDCNSERYYDFSDIFDNYKEYKFETNNYYFSVERDINNMFSRSDLENIIYGKDNVILYKKK